MTCFIFGSRSPLLSVLPPFNNSLARKPVKCPVFTSISRSLRLLPASSLVPAVITDAWFQAASFAKPSRSAIPMFFAMAICCGSHLAISFNSKPPALPAAMAALSISGSFSGSMLYDCFARMAMVASSSGEAPDAVAPFMMPGNMRIASLMGTAPEAMMASSASAAASRVPPPA